MENTTDKKEGFSEDPVWRTFDALPETIKGVLTSTAFEKRIDTIAKEGGVVEKAPDILRISEEVLIGILPIRKFVRALAEKAQLEEDQARTIGYAIRDQIFAEVAEDLARIHQTSKAPDSIPKIQGNTVNLKDMRP